MDRLVSDDEKRGRTKWAVAESKRMKAEGKETPKWMDELVAEDAKWANRWAACKVASLQQANEEAPQWMIENGRKGIMDAASEKAAELQERSTRWRRRRTRTRQSWTPRATCRLPTRGCWPR